MTETTDARHFRLALQSFVGKDKLHNQTTMAKTSGVSRTLINEILHAKRFAGRVAQEKIARACGFSLADFLALGQVLDVEKKSRHRGRRTISTLQAEEAAIYSPAIPPQQFEVFRQIHQGAPPRGPLGEQGPGGPFFPNSLEKFRLSQKPIPMLGLVECDISGWYNAMDIALSSSMVTLGPHSFAVLAEGESMRPEGIGRGMLCYCDPDEEPLKGDAVYVGTLGPNGQEMGAIKIFWGWGMKAGNGEAWLKLRGWRKIDNSERQSNYSMEIPAANIIMLATVVLVRRRL